MAFSYNGHWTLTSALVVKYGDVLPRLLAGPSMIREKKFKSYNHRQRKRNAHSSPLFRGRRRPGGVGNKI